MLSYNIAHYIFSNPAAPFLFETSETPRVSPTKQLFSNANDASVSYEKIYNDSRKIAASLHSKLNSFSLLPAQRATIPPVILLHLPNCIQYPTIVFGALAAGYTLSPVNPALTPQELAHIISASRPAIVVSHLKTGVRAIREALALVGKNNKSNYVLHDANIFTVDISEDSYGQQSSFPANTSYQSDWTNLFHPTDLMDPVEITQEQSKTRAAFILWSSGTSGKSKGVVLSHHAMIYNVNQIWHGNSSYNDDERCVGAVPFFHTFGLCNVLLLAPIMGISVLVLSKFDPEGFLALNVHHKATRILIAPPIAVLLAKSPLVDKYDLSSLKSGISGGAPLGTDIIEAVYARLNILIKIGYGLTETGGVTVQKANTWDEYKPLLGSSGHLFSGVQAKVISTTTNGKVCEQGEPGEILVKSDGGMLEYLNNKEATEEAIDKDGWYHTGDVGKITQGNVLWIIDRLKEIIKVKGFQVSPVEIEEQICCLPQINDAAVTSVWNDEMQSELPCAYIVPKDPELIKIIISSPSVSTFSPLSSTNLTTELIKLGENVKTFIEKTFIKYKWLRGGIVFVENIPKSPSGKLLRRLLPESKGIYFDIYKNSRANL